MKRRSLLRLLGSGASAVAAARGPGATGLSVLAASTASAATRFGRGDTRIALLLPDEKGPFRHAGNAVLMGVQAAHGVDGAGVVVETFEVDDERTDLPGLLQRLAGRGYALAIGPMTRASVNRLARLAAPPLPLLTLNVPDPGHRLAPECVQFGLLVEDEGAQIAGFAIEHAFRSVHGTLPRALAVVERESSLAQRSGDAFLAAWRQHGGESYERLAIDDRMLYELPRTLANVHVDAVFVALSPQAVPAVREALGAHVALYGTSRLDIGAIPDTKAGELLAMPALDGLHIVEMPWLATPEHPAVLVYPRSPRIPHLELQRLYALGIDAYRMGRELIEGRRQLALDGVTGWLSVDLAVNPRVERLSTVCVYRDGLLVPVDMPGIRYSPDNISPSAPDDHGGVVQPDAPPVPGQPARPDAPSSPGFEPVPRRPDAGGWQQPAAPHGFEPVPRAPGSPGFEPVPRAPGSSGFVPVPPAASSR